MQSHRAPQPCRTYGAGVPASCVPHVPEAQGSVPRRGTAARAPHSYPPRACGSYRVPLTVCGAVTAGSEATSAPKKQSLLDQRAEMLASGSLVPLSKEEEKSAEETQILSSIDSNFKPLMSVQELATGITYSESMETGWRPPSHVRAMTEEEKQETRDKWCAQP